MQYLRIKNVPLKLLEDPKYGEGKCLAFCACGFTELVLARSSIQYRNDSDEFIQVLPISDQDKFDLIWQMFQDDVSALDESDPSIDSTCELVDAEKYLAEKQVAIETRAAQKLANA